MDLEEIAISAGNCVDSAQDSNYWRALVNAALNLQVPEAMELVNQSQYNQNFINSIKDNNHITKVTLEIMLKNMLKKKERVRRLPGN